MSGTERELKQRHLDGLLQTEGMLSAPPVLVRAHSDQATTGSAASPAALAASCRPAGGVPLLSLPGCCGGGEAQLLLLLPLSSPLDELLLLLLLLPAGTCNSRKAEQI